MVKMDFQTHQSIEKWTENISFRHINIPCPVTSMTFLSLKWTVKLNMAWRPAARLGPPDLPVGERGVPPAYLDPASERQLPASDWSKWGGPTYFSQADFERQLTGPDYEVTKKVEPIRNGPNPIFESYTIPRHELRSNFWIFSKFLLKFQNSITLLIMLRFSSGLF